MALGGTGRQHAVLAVECLDRRLLVDAKHGGVIRRVQIQADHVGRLGLQVRIVRDHVNVQPIRTHAMLSPNALHGQERHVAQFSSQLAAAPMRRAILRQCLTVRFNTRASCLATERKRARPECRETNPAKPCCSNVVVQRDTNRSLQAARIGCQRDAPRQPTTAQIAPGEPTPHCRNACVSPYSDQCVVRSSASVDP